MKPTLYVDNELDRCLRISRESELMNIAAAAAALRDSETSVDRAVTKLERFLTTLKNLAVEVHVTSGSKLCLIR